jgi:hypothetical protein
MAVILSRLVMLQKAVEPIDVFVLGDTNIRYGTISGMYRISASSGINSYYETEVWDDGYEEYVTEGQPNYVLIEVDVSGYSKLTINAKTASSYDNQGKVGWGLSNTNSSNDIYSTLTTSAKDYEFDISGQNTIYIKIYSRYYPVYVYGIGLE